MAQDKSAVGIDYYVMGTDCSMKMVYCYYTFTPQCGKFFFVELWLSETDWEKCLLYMFMFVRRVVSHRLLKSPKFRIYNLEAIPTIINWL